MDVNHMDTFQSPTTPRHTLDSLISMLKYGLAVFREAAAITNDPDLQEFFARRSLQRVRFVGELEVALRRLGQKKHFQNHESSVATAAHRGWLNLTAAVTQQDTSAILDEVERGEKHVVSAYRHALEQDGWSFATRAILERHEDGVKHCYEEVIRLRQNLSVVRIG